MDKVKIFFKGVGGKIKQFFGALVGNNNAGPVNDAGMNNAGVDPNANFNNPMSQKIPQNYGGANAGMPEPQGEQRALGGISLNSDGTVKQPLNFTQRVADNTPVKPPENFNGAGMNLPKTADFKSKIEFIEFLRGVPSNILSKEERMIIASAMSFNERKIDSIMAPKEDITFVRENDLLGPLALDKLHKTGFVSFPVMDTIGRIVGVLNTEQLGNLNIQPTDKAGKYMDQNVNYARNDYSCEMVLGVFVRTNAPFLVVIDKNERIVGFLYFEDLMYSLTGRDMFDGFTDDNNSRLVATRRIKN